MPREFGVGSFIISVRRHLDNYYVHYDPESPSEEDIREAFEEGFTISEYTRWFAEENGLEALSLLEI